MKRLWGRKVSDLAFYQFVEILKYKCQNISVSSVKSGNGLLQQNLVATADIETKIFLLTIGSGRVLNVVHTTTET